MHRARENFTQAIASHPEFGSLALALIDAGEKSGTLDIMLERAAEHAEQQALRQSQLNQALRYPAAIALTSLIVSTVMLLKVVPSFAASFGNMGNELPTITLWVLSLSQWLSANFWQLLLVAITSIGLFIYFYKTNTRLRLWCANTAFGLPILANSSKRLVARVLLRHYPPHLAQACLWHRVLFWRGEPVIMCYF